MTTFKWKSKGYYGKIKANSKNEAKALLEKKGFSIEHIEKSLKLPHFLNRIKQKDIIRILNGINQSISSNLSLLDSIKIIHENEAPSLLNDILEDIIKKIEHGYLLSDTLSFYPTYFDKITLAFVKSGEISGDLKTPLKRLLMYKKRISVLKQKIIISMIYPFITFLATMITVGFILIFITPKLNHFYQDFSKTPPISTQVLISISDFLTHHTKSLGLTLILFLILWQIFKKSFYTAALNAIKKMPWLKSISNKLVLYQLFYLINILTKSHINMSDALSLIISSLPKPYQLELMNIKTQIESGFSVSTSFSSSKLISLKAIQLIHIGEQSGNLHPTMKTLSSLYRDELDFFLEKVLALIEPIMLIVTSLIVGTVLILLYLPIFNLGAMI